MFVMEDGKGCVITGAGAPPKIPAAPMSVRRKDRRHVEEVGKAFVNLDVERLTSIEAQTLIRVVEDGPMSSDDVPSLPSALFLTRASWVVDVLVHGEMGYHAATQEGLLAYCRLLGVDSVAEGRLKRQCAHHVQKTK